MIIGSPGTFGGRLLSRLSSNQRRWKIRPNVTRTEAMTKNPGIPRYVYAELNTPPDMMPWRNMVESEDSVIFQVKIEQAVNSLLTRGSCNAEEEFLREDRDMSATR